MKKPLILLFVISLSSVSCNFFDDKVKGKVIARVNDHYLYNKDLEEVIPNNVSASDSALRAKTYIDNWAIKKIMLDKAKFNLPVKKQQKFDSLANNYKEELYRQSYKNALINQKIDDNISDSLILDYYDSHKQAFKINEYLLQLRYMVLSDKLKDKKEYIKRFWRFNDQDKAYLNKNSIAIKSLMLKDSVWVKSIDIFKQLKKLDSIDRKQFHIPNNRYTLKDSTQTYFFNINKVKGPNSVAPYSYIKSKIKQILINRKKLTLGDQIEKEIKADAYDNKSFEIYD
ncbi:MAG: hypothetical protein RI558_00925 [Psychroflexus sp.]|nr:hypothetical protein [Psychroflexus sp.]MDR9447719.1 hypothetical protein [Psychroflexus sp.]